MKRFHFLATIFWGLAIIPTVIWWKESILWIALISCYANLVGHWGAYQAAKVEKKMVEEDDRE